MKLRSWQHIFAAAVVLTFAGCGGGGGGGAGSAPAAATPFASVVDMSVSKTTVAPGESFDVAFTVHFDTAIVELHVNTSDTPDAPLPAGANTSASFILTSNCTGRDITGASPNPVDHCTITANSNDRFTETGVFRCAFALFDPANPAGTRKLTCESAPDGFAATDKGGRDPSRIGATFAIIGVCAPFTDAQAVLAHSCASAARPMTFM